jgi:hypothetical protein
MTLWNRISNWLRGVKRGPQNLGYIVQDDGELLLTKYDKSQPFVWRGPVPDVELTPEQQATIDRMRKTVEEIRANRTISS